MPDSLADILADTDETEFNQARESERVVPPSPAGREPAAEPGRSLAEQAPDPLTPAPKEDQPKHQVPLATFLEEQKERKRLERLHAEDNIRQARIEERLRILNERAIQAQPQEQVPDKASDPVGYLEYQIKQTQQGVGKTDQLERRLQQWEQAQRLSVAVDAQEKAFAKTTPDYWGALEHVSQVRLNQYKLVMPEEQAAQAVVNDAQMWVNACLAAGKNPAEASYELAKAYGYNPQNTNNPAETKPAGAEAARNADGTFAKAVNPKVEKAKENLKTVQRGVDTKSLSQTTGGAAKTELSIEDLADMSDEEFDKATAGKSWRKYWVA